MRRAKRMLKYLKDKSCIYNCANKYIETNKKEWGKYTVSYRLNPVINAHLFYGTLQAISIFKQQNPITKSALTLLWSWPLQNVSCTWGMHERHAGETQHICKHANYFSKLHLLVLNSIEYGSTTTWSLSFWGGRATWSQRALCNS